MLFLNGNTSVLIPDWLLFLSSYCTIYWCFKRSTVCRLFYDDRDNVCEIICQPSIFIIRSLCGIFGLPLDVSPFLCSLFLAFLFLHHAFELLDEGGVTWSLFIRRFFFLPIRPNASCFCISISLCVRVCVLNLNDIVNPLSSFIPKSERDREKKRERAKETKVRKKLHFSDVCELSYIFHYIFFSGLFSFVSINQTKA